MTLTRLEIIKCMLACNCITAWTCWRTPIEQIIIIFCSNIESVCLFQNELSWTCLSFAEWLCYLAHWRAVPLAWVIAPPLIPHQPVITNLWRSVATSWKSQQSVVSCSVVKPRRWLPSVVCRATVYQFRPLPVGWTPARDQALIRGCRPGGLGKALLLL